MKESEKKIIARALDMKETLKLRFDREFDIIYLDDSYIGMLMSMLPNFNKATAYTYRSEISFEDLISIMKKNSNGNQFYVTRDFMVIPAFNDDVEGWIFKVSGYFGLIKI